MTDYSLPEAGNAIEIGQRAKRLRTLLGLTIDQLAAAAKVDPDDVSAMEAGRPVSLATALAIHRELSGDNVGATLFTSPRLRSIAEVEAFERRRLAGR